MTPKFNKDDPRRLAKPSEQNLFLRVLVVCDGIECEPIIPVVVGCTLLEYTENAFQDYARQAVYQEFGSVIMPGQPLLVWDEENTPVYILEQMWDAYHEKRGMPATARDADQENVLRIFTVAYEENEKKKG